MSYNEQDRSAEYAAYYHVQAIQRFQAACMEQEAGNYDLALVFYDQAYQLLQQSVQYSGYDTPHEMLYCNFSFKVADFSQITWRRVCFNTHEIWVDAITDVSHNVAHLFSGENVVREEQVLTYFS
jgi:hypothetical protein